MRFGGLQITPGTGRLTLKVVRLTIQVLALAASLGFVYVPPSSAGTMTLYSCKTTSGRSAGTTGWSVQIGGLSPGMDSSSTRMRTSDSCSEGPTGTLRAQINGPHGRVPGEMVSWTFRPAPGTSITTFAASVCGRALMRGSAAEINWDLGFGNSGSRLAATMDQPKYLGCVGTPPWRADPANSFQAIDLTSSRILFTAKCGQGGCLEMDGMPSDIEISSFRADIRDDSPPVVSSVRGPLASNASHAGIEAVDFDAIDHGVGVFRAVAEVRIQSAGPWREMANRTMAPETACSPLRETAYLYEFDSPQPCPLSGIGGLSLDNALLPSGLHEIRVFVEDAAGNRADVIPQRTYTVRDRATTVAAASPLATATNGRGASRSAQLRITAPGRTRLPSAGPFRLAGRLLDLDSNPIPNATLLIQMRAFLPKPDTAQGPWTTVGETLTDQDGVFRARIPRGGSRSLLVTYKAAPNDANPSANAQTDVTVPAQVTVRARRSRVRNGHSVVFSGRVAGPIPPGGVLVALEAREPGRWVPVATTRRWVRTRPSGTFTLSYRFLRTFRPASYRFRVVADEDSAFQYGRGASRSIAIHVRP